MGMTVRTAAALLPLVGPGAQGGAECPDVFGDEADENPAVPLLMPVSSGEEQGEDVPPGADNADAPPYAPGEETEAKVAAPPVLPVFPAKCGKVAALEQSDADTPAISLGDDGDCETAAAPTVRG